jgi:uncharacterized protein (TIGR03437 family)
MWKLLLATLVCGVAQAQTNLSPLPCSEEGSLKSLNANVATSVDFVNQTTQTVQVYWLNYMGARVLYFPLAAGASRVQQTFVTHPWVIADTSNNCIEIFQPVSGPGVADITTTPGGGAATLSVSPSTMQFSGPVGGDSPPPQILSVTPATSGSAKFNVQVDGGSVGSAPPAFLSVQPLTGTAPAALAVSTNTSGLAAGTYSGRILISNPAEPAGTAPTIVAVTLNVNSAPPKLTVSPAILQLTTRAATPGTLVGDLIVSNTGGGTMTFNASTTSPWVAAITPSSGQTTVGAPVRLHVEVNTSGLNIGSYNNSIHISSSGGTADIPITLFVSADGPILSAVPNGVFFHGRQNAGITASKTVEILNIGDPNTTVHWTATLLSGSNWLNLVTASGTATATNPGTLTVTPLQNATQLAVGPYYALIQISDPSALNSPQYVVAVLNVNPDSVFPSPDATPGGLVFTSPAGGAAPSAQQVQINTSSATPIAFQASTTTDDGGTWLNVTPASGNTSGQTAGTASVSVNPAGLAAGIYTGDVTFSIGQIIESVEVTFVVQPTGAAGGIARPHPEVSCSPSKMAMTEVGLVNNFSVPAGWPASLIVQLNNDCGSVVTNGNVTANFSNGDPPLALTGDSLGNYIASWQPGTVNPQLVVTLSASSGNLQPATRKLFGGIAQNLTPPPSLAAGGTLNNLNPVVGGALSPGVIAEVFGANLAASSSATGKLPLPTDFNNTFAQIGPFRAPLYFLSSGQLDVQLPSEINSNQQLPVVLSVNNALTLPVTLNIVPNTPGVLSDFKGPTPPYVQNGAHIIAQHLDGSTVDSKKPGKAGEFLVMYLVGLGETDNPVPSGHPAPSSPLSNVKNQPTVTVDSLPSKTVFAGLTPGFVGLYQIDFQVPTGVHTGEVVVTVTQNGIAANPTLLSVSQ